LYKNRTFTVLKSLTPKRRTLYKILIMSEERNSYHQPVMLQESIEGLDVKPGGVYVDATYGGGGHSRAILERLGDRGRLFGFDRDADAESNIAADERFTFVRSDFRYLQNFMRYHKVDAIDGLIADLGVSSHHFDAAQRGFSFRFDAPLDMRMNNRSGKTAADVLNSYSEERLAAILHEYGELPNSRRLAAALVAARNSKMFETIADLTEALTPFAGRDGDNQFTARVFQAIRIEVNGELDAIAEMLPQALKLLRKGGRLAVISYHSLEDRMVKNFMKTGNTVGAVEQDMYGNKPSPLRSVVRLQTPTTSEIYRNPRARSAKLRIGELKQN